jgi:hypothetical protein
MKKPRFTDVLVVQALLKHESVVLKGVLCREMGITPANFNKLKSECIMRNLEGLTLQRGKPQLLRTYNDTEFTTKEFEWWCKEQEIEIQFIQPARPMQRVKLKGLTESTTKQFSMLKSHIYTRNTSPDKRMD